MEYLNGTINIIQNMINQYIEKYGMKNQYVKIIVALITCIILYFLIKGTQSIMWIILLLYVNSINSYISLESW